MEIIREIREIDSDTIIITMPKAFRKKKVEILVLPLEISEKEEIESKDKKKSELNTSGLCGIWQDERTSEEIINDIYSHRTGFGNRQVEL